MIFKHFSYLFSSLCVALHCFFWAQRVSSGLLCMPYYLGSDGIAMDMTILYKHLPTVLVNVDCNSVSLSASLVDP